MALKFRPLHPSFAAEASAIELASLRDPAAFATLRAAMDEYAVLVFRDQMFNDRSQVEFAQTFDGALHANTGAAAIGKTRLETEAVSDISNVGADGELFKPTDRGRMYVFGNRLWHTDASFQDPPGRSSMLSARVLPPVNADTEFADLRAAHDALDTATRSLLEGLRAHHSIAYSRQTLGFEFSAEEAARLAGAVHPLVRTNPRTGRRALYLAAHASTIIGWPVPEARLLLRELMDHATERRFVYRHVWRPHDLVIWDNLATMHRGTRFDDTMHRRELRRVTTLDVPL